jgi:2-keto-4-pentenoate hydratase/2-oxohepta-3-ene-1,7-dioic acid hydratase in catechol pathway
MRVARFLHQGIAGYGIHLEDGMQPVAWEPFEGGGPESYQKLAYDDLIIGIGLNYSDHAREVGMEPGDEPTIFLKAPSTVLEPGGTIIYPGRSKRVDYEAELAVVIGREASSVSAEEALEHVFGYTCGLDITARDLQAEDGQWTRSKNFDTFCPLGPWVETELDASDLEISLRLNGEVKQQSRTSRMVFGVAELVCFLSGIMTLYPGDVIMTGTPSGIGPVSPGDSLEMTIEGIGSLSCNVG